MIDPLDLQLGRYLDEIEASDAKDDWMNARIQVLMQGIYSPTQRDNIIEAIGNTNQANIEVITDMVNKLSESLAAFIQEVSYDYWCKQAEVQAEAEWRRR